MFGYTGLAGGYAEYLLTHTDGENQGLLQHYVASNFDIADSVCPAPSSSPISRSICWRPSRIRLPLPWQTHWRISPW